MLVPNYTMSCFKLVNGLCDEDERMMVFFWWGQRKQEKKIHLVGWKQLCKPKGESRYGLLGSKNFQYGDAWQTELVDLGR